MNEIDFSYHFNMIKSNGKEACMVGWDHAWSYNIRHPNLIQQNGTCFKEVHVFIKLFFMNEWESTTWVNCLK